MSDVVSGLDRELAGGESAPTALTDAIEDALTAFCETRWPGAVFPTAKRAVAHEASKAAAKHYRKETVDAQAGGGTT